ncbi:N-terminal acetyltransferase A complex catalytic subunit ard1 [Taiwanofungus camphoratus]|nr:N-terminal acetyltransferase A complex catalytic subunit ard1 [Antrodia cinnamomea]KAI0944934.1 N-terminal acetyltransferase A complex catalytic subunit ard1 [Antrodia cinnamomea]KAI0945554.1 N-terminal acetyltransferase A complex catalytic subunit ard1 [Antrodia cinnamomea]
MAATMNALYYHAPRNFEVRQVTIPQVRDDEVLFKVVCCGVCGTDGHVHEGEFITKFPLIPGHEVVGVIAEVGKSVTGFAKGDRCVADPGMTCESCFYCRRGQSLLCENFIGKGVSTEGGFSEYVVLLVFPLSSIMILMELDSEARKVYKIHNLTDEEATLIEPAACAIHGMDKLDTAVGVEALVIGAGPTGLILAQLLKLNGASKVVIAANKGIKTDIARQLDAGDEYVELDRANPEPQWEKLKKENPYGFDIVVEATGSEKIANDAINYVRRGGTLMIYGVYDNAALVHWPPSKIFGDEINIIGSFAQAYCFPRAVAYLDSGKVKVKGMVTDVYTIADYQKALDKMNSRGALKIVIKPQ